MKYIFLSLFVSLSYFADINQEPKSSKKADKELHDPVCGMKVKKNAAYSSTYKDKEHKFCSKMCKEKFDAAPEKYIKK
ncbi:YHS domain-containing protein [Emticicia sp. 17c]|uniref:YHS domain-containing protein n=1 Tax=Emticicia sp. 17c TaxID=3127704 RepID=UPI00301C546C